LWLTRQIHPLHLKFDGRKTMTSKDLPYKGDSAIFIAHHAHSGNELFRKRSGNVCHAQKQCFKTIADQFLKEWESRSF